MLLVSEMYYMQQKAGCLKFDWPRTVLWKSPGPPPAWAFEKNVTANPYFLFIMQYEKLKKKNKVKQHLSAKVSSMLCELPLHLTCVELSTDKVIFTALILLSNSRLNNC